jgi:hypothetical protein
MTNPILRFLQAIPPTIRDKVVGLGEDFKNASGQMAGTGYDEVPKPYQTQLQQLLSSLSLAGLAQTSSLPFAPRGAGTLGTVKLPETLTKVIENKLVKTNASPDQLWNNNKLTEHEIALQTAHDNAMRSIEDGGLGLTEGNTAMDRAKALGFGTPTYHYSQHSGPIDKFKTRPVEYGDYPFEAFGVHSGTKEAAAARFSGLQGFDGLHPNDVIDKGFSLDPKGQTLPLLIKGGRQYQSNRMLHGKPRELPTEGEIGRLMNDIPHFKESIWNKYDTLPYRNLVEDPGSKSYVSPPQNIRSRFAAFDPAKKDSTNIMATIAGLSPLGLLLKQMLSRDDKRK